MADVPAGSKFFPFQFSDKSGPGPMGQVNERADRWRCACKKIHRDLSVCKCRSIRRLKNGKLSRATKTIRINLKKKREYQKKSYRPFLKKKREYQKKSYRPFLKKKRRG